MKRLVSLTAAFGVMTAFAVNAGAANIAWDGITWGINNNSVAVDGGGDLVMTGVDARQYHGYDSYGALVGVYPYSGNVPGQSHATWDPGTFVSQWFQATYTDSGAGVGAAPYFMVETNDANYNGIYLSSEGVGSTAMGYVGTRDNYSTWYDGPLYTRSAGTHTLALLLTADENLKAYYDGNLAATVLASGLSSLEHIYLGSFGASGQTLKYTDFQIGRDSLPPSVPEPGTLVLLITAGLGALCYAWRRRRS